MITYCDKLVMLYKHCTSYEEYYIDGRLPKVIIFLIKLRKNYYSLYTMAY